MTNEEIKKVLDPHKKWLNNEQGGVLADLHGIYLGKADLCGADMRRADLSDAYLRGADLRCADLRGTNLREANLSEANLSGANLRDAELNEADLRGANLRKANLRKANLYGADLRGADLREADLDFSCFPLWCGGSKFKCDTKLVYQLLAHLCTLEFDDTEGIKELIIPFADESHRATDLGVRRIQYY